MCRDTVRSERLTGISGYCDEGSAPSPVSFVRVCLRSAGDVHPGRRIAKEAASSTQDVERRPPLRQHVDERPSQPRRHSLPEFEPPPFQRSPAAVVAFLRSCIHALTERLSRLAPVDERFLAHPSFPTDIHPERGERRNRLGEGGIASRARRRRLAVSPRAIGHLAKGGPAWRSG